MRWWPLNRHLAATLRALRADDRPLRDAYARRAHWTVAMMRDRLAEPGDHQRLVWPDFENYRDFIFATAAHSRRSDCVKLWRRGSSPVLRAFKFAAISDFRIVTVEMWWRIGRVEFWPDELLDDSEGRPRYSVALD